MTNGEEIASFSNLSQVRFLVIDEADRMVEDGHFPELYRIFSRIRDHEKLADRGIDPVEAEAAAKRGVDVNESGDEEEEKNELAEEDTVAMQQIETEIERNDIVDGSGDVLRGMAAPMINNKAAAASVVFRVNQRQTLLYSATLLSSASGANNSKSKRTEQIPFSEPVLSRSKITAKKYLPSFLTQLLEAVAVQPTITIVKASNAPVSATRPNDSLVPTTTVSSESSARGKVTVPPSSKDNSMATLPVGLEQLEIKMPAEEKDVMAYYFLVKVNK